MMSYALDLFELPKTVSPGAIHSSQANNSRTILMPITESDIEKIAQLAHLEITDDERAMFAPQISEIVTYVEQLNAIDTSAVEPALGGLTPQGEQTESSRADEGQPSLGQKVALDQAPDPAAGHFRVPKVL